MEGQTIAVIVTAVTAPVGAYLLAARKMSGRIATSDASQLWNKAREIRHEYRGQLQAARERISTLESRVGALEARNDELIDQNTRLRAELAKRLEELAGHVRAAGSPGLHTPSHRRRT